MSFAAFASELEKSGWQQNDDPLLPANYWIFPTLQLKKRQLFLTSDFYILVFEVPRFHPRVYQGMGHTLMTLNSWAAEQSGAWQTWQHHIITIFLAQDGIFRSPLYEWETLTDADLQEITDPKVRSNYHELVHGSELLATMPMIFQGAGMKAAYIADLRKQTYYFQRFKLPRLNFMQRAYVQVDDALNSAFGLTNDQQPQGSLQKRWGATPEKFTKMNGGVLASLVLLMPISFLAFGWMLGVESIFVAILYSLANLSVAISGVLYTAQLVPKQSNWKSRLLLMFAMLILFIYIMGAFCGIAAIQDF